MCQSPGVDCPAMPNSTAVYEAGDDSRLSLTNKRWIWPPRGEQLAPPGSAARGEPPAWLLHVLAQRGLTGPDDITRYLAPSLAFLDDPASMADMLAAVTVLERALEAGKRIVVYGDYDVDGVCSTALLVETMRKLGADVGYYIPDRRSEGYGLNATAVRDLCGRAQVLVTTDCGITACEEVALARRERLHRPQTARLRVPVQGAVRYRRRLHAGRCAQAQPARARLVWRAPRARPT